MCWQKAGVQPWLMVVNTSGYTWEENQWTGVLQQVEGNKNALELYLTLANPCL
jgi:hypothetical protein